MNYIIHYHDIISTIEIIPGESNACASIAMIAAENILDEMDSALTTNDALHSHLHNEYENGRIVKLLLKLGDPHICMLVSTTCLLGLLEFMKLISAEDFPQT